MKRGAGSLSRRFALGLPSFTSPTIDATLDYMEIRLSPDQEAHLAALAASVGRPADELVQETLADAESAARVFGDVHGLALAYRLTSYNAAYLELALRRNLSLATLDDDLIRARKAAGITVL